MSGVGNDRERVLGFRWRRHGLDAAPGSVGVDDLALLDFGVQDTGGDGASWAMRIRGVDVPHGLVGSGELALAWTLRGAPHAYRRRDLERIAVATAPYEEADAAKRVFDAAKPLRDAGVAVLDALAVVAERMVGLVEAASGRELVKGELSSALTAISEEYHLRWCNPCQATHLYEQPFRLSALQAGLELDAGTSPPVLRPVPGLGPNLYRRLATEAVRRFDPIRNHLRFFGPATHKQTAAFLDTTVAVVKRHWPDDAVEVAPGEWVLADDADALGEGPASGGVVRLLGPYDPYLQTRDRERLVSDEGHRRDLWRVLGRPGAIALDGDIVGTWRPVTKSKRFGITIDGWRRLTRPERVAVEAEAERLAEHRGLAFAGVGVADAH